MHGQACPCRGLKWRDFLDSMLGVGDKRSLFFVSLHRNAERKRTRNEQTQPDLAAGRQGPAGQPQSGPKGSPPRRPSAWRNTAPTSCRRAAKIRIPDFPGTVCRLPGDHPHRCRSDLCGAGGCGEYGGHPGGYHHERHPGHRPDHQGRGVPRQPQTDVCPHRQGDPGRQDHPDPRPGRGPVGTWWCWRPATPSAPTAGCWSAPA